MSRQNELVQGYLGTRLPDYAGSSEYVQNHRWIDFSHNASPLRQSQNSEWANDYRGPSER